MNYVLLFGDIKVGEITGNREIVIKISEVDVGIWDERQSVHSFRREMLRKKCDWRMAQEKEG